MLHYATLQREKFQMVSYTPSFGQQHHTLLLLSLGAAGCGLKVTHSPQTTQIGMVPKQPAIPESFLKLQPAWHYIAKYGIMVSMVIISLCLLS